MNDQRLETLIGNLLRAGVLLAAAIVLSGGLFYLVQHGGDRVHYRNFVAGSNSLRTIAGVTSSAVHLNAEGIIQFGLLLLIATPVARVIMAIAGFALERDHLYVVVSSIVLAVLLFSLLHAT